MSSISPGDKVEVATADQTYEGFLIESPKKDVVIIKLQNGYNIGVQKSKVKSIKLKEKINHKKTSKAYTVEYKKGLPVISILHTGGTIASRVDYKTGGTIAAFTPEEIVHMIPELKNIANIKSRLLSNMWSQDMRFAHYNIMAKEIEKEVKSGVDGVILTHGTDTMHFTSAALSFILEGINIPVILVGSQRSSDRGSSDAASNMISACNFITKVKDFADVGICMHSTMSDNKCSILPGCKVRKMHTSRRDAFKPINTIPWAEVTYPEGAVHILNHHYRKKNTLSKLSLKLLNENLKVGLLKAHTNMYAEQFLAYKKFKGLVIEASGLGNLPTSKIDNYTKEHAKIFNALKALAKEGVEIALAPQTIYGRLNLNVYSNQREMKEVGILGDYCDMTPETAFIKMAWLLSNYPKETKKMFSQDLRGEISKKVMFE